MEIVINKQALVDIANIVAQGPFVKVRGTIESIESTLMANQNPDEENVTIELSNESFNLIGEMLNEVAYRTAAPLVNLLNDAIQVAEFKAQNTASEEVADATEDTNKEEPEYIPVVAEKTSETNGDVFND